MTIPAHPKIYHIAHVDRLPSIIADGCLWCDAEIIRRDPAGTAIGMNKIKQRRLGLRLASHKLLHVGDCVPFYFCPRSVMLFVIHRANDEELAYKGGQGPIIHIEADLRRCVAWAERNHRRWAFTLSNAGSYFFEDRCDLGQLDEVNWDAVQSNQWGGPGISASIKEGKQAEFLMEHGFPWDLVELIGVHSKSIYGQVTNALPKSGHRPKIEIKSDWYY